MCEDARTEKEGSLNHDPEHATFVFKGAVYCSKPCQDAAEKSSSATALEAA